MKVGEVLNLENLGKRKFDVNEIFGAIRNNIKVWSWGAHAWTKNKDEWLRFKCNGHHHKGHVYIVLNYNDTFIVYYTTTKGTIQAIDEEVYIDSLIDTIDKRVEYIDKYKDN